VQHKERLCSDAKQMQYRRFQGEAVHGIASESPPDGTYVTWPHYTGTASDTESEDDTAFDLLGRLVAVIDDVASDFVYGLDGTPGRPGGVMDVSFLSSMASGHLLSADGHKRWLQFLHVWQNGGWSLRALLQVTDELRPLQYEFDLEMADLANVQAAQLAPALQNSVTSKKRNMPGFQASWQSCKDISHSAMQCFCQQKMLLNGCP